MYDGLAHPFISPEDLLPVLALAVWAGLSGPANARWIVLLLPLGWLLGGALGLALPASHAILSIELVSGIIIGAAAAANPAISRAVLLCAATALGLLHGIAATAGDGGGLIAACGAALTVGACFAIVAGQVTSLSVDWTRIAARVLSSWTAAIGLLQLGWIWRGGSP